VCVPCSVMLLFLYDVGSDS